MSIYELPSTPEVTVTVNGFECQLLDYTDGVTWSSQWGQDSGGGGCWEASWSMPNLDPNFNHPSFKLGAPVELKVGSWVVWAGKLAAIDRYAPWKFTASGYVQYAKDYVSLDASGNSSSTANDVLGRAIDRGYDVRFFGDFAGIGDTSLVTGDSTAALNTLPALLSATALKAGMRWAVDAMKVIYAAPDPTKPTWHLVPSTALVGVMDPDFVTDGYARYIPGTHGQSPTGGYDFDDGTYLYQTAHVQNPKALAVMGEVREALVDLRPLGIISRATALANLQNRMDLAGPRAGFTNGIKANWWEILSPGGTVVPPWMMNAGDLVRCHNIIGQDGNLDFGAYVDIVLGNVSYNAGDFTIQLDPVGLRARDLTNIFADATAPAAADSGVAQNPANGWFSAA